MFVLWRKETTTTTYAFIELLVLLQVGYCFYALLEDDIAVTRNQLGALDARVPFRVVDDNSERHVDRRSEHVVATDRLVDHARKVAVHLQ